MDSAGMGAVIDFFTHCQKAVRMLIAGVSPGVSEFFKLTGVDTLIPMPSTVEEPEPRINAAKA